MLGVILKGSIKRQSIFRSLFEQYLLSIESSKGRVIDLGGIKKPFPGYAKALRAEIATITTVNISPDVGADIVGDAATTGLDAEIAEEVWAFNILEHVEHPERILTEAHRLLKPKARFLAVTPFLLGIHGEPDDFARYTKSKLQNLLVEAQFKNIAVTAIGYGPFIASVFQVQLLLPRLFAIPAIWMAWLTDSVLFFLRPQWKDKWPLGYFIEAEVC